MACRRSSDGLSQGQWGTVTGNLPFDKAGDDNSCNSNSTSLNNFFSIRVSRPPVVGLEHGDQFPLFVGVLLAFVLFLRSRCASRGGGFVERRSRAVYADVC